MKMLIISLILLQTKTIAAAPASNGGEKKLITKDYYQDSFVKYESKHDIVSIVVDISALNINENEDRKTDNGPDLIFFFVEADLNSDGKRTYQGLYVFQNGTATKLLDNGRAAAASSDGSKKVFFGAQDGIYEYKSETNEAIKYGPVSDSIISIAMTNTSDVIYILTEDHELYKVTEAGNSKAKVDEVVNAQEVVLDYSNNIYFYAEDKKPYVLTVTGMKQIEGLPNNPSKVNLLKPFFIIKENLPGVPFIVDNTAYLIFPNGSSVRTNYEFSPDAKPSALAVEATLVQYYAYNKKIYEYNIVAMIFGKIFELVKDFFKGINTAIQSFASEIVERKNNIV